MSFRRRARNLAVLLGGVVLGVLTIALVAWVYYRTVAYDTAELMLEDRLDLPPEALELEEISDDGAVRIALRDVVLHGEDGDTIVAAPVVRTLLNPSSMAEGESFHLSEVELEDPYLRLVRRPDGSLNLMEAVGVTAGGEEVDVEGDDGGRGFVLRDVRVTSGRVRLATPWQPDSATAGEEPAEDVQLAEIDGTLMRVRGIRDLDALLPLVRVGGGDGWRVVIASMDARLTNPDLAIVQVRGEVEEAEDGGIRFALEEVRTAASQIEATGMLRLAEGDDPLELDASVRAQPLAVEDLRWMFPALPASGEIRFTADTESVGDGRTAFIVRDLDVALPDTRVSGGLTVVFGGDAAPAFRDTRLLVEPLDVEVVKQFASAAGFDAIGDLPIQGEIRGTIVTADTVVGTSEGALRLDLLALLQPADTVAPRADAVELSHVGITGAVALGEGDEAVRLEGLRLDLSPLHLPLLAPILPEQRDRLRGAVSGILALTGPPGDLRVESDQITYEVGDAAPTRITGLTGRIITDPALRYELRGRMEPLALAALTELVPALPFQEAQVSGPFAVAGDSGAIRFSTDLTGSAGSITAGGDIALGETARVDVSGQVVAFRPQQMFAQSSALPGGALTGSFAARGPLDDLRFNLDLAQGEGSFTLEGRFASGAGPPSLNVSGQVIDFPLGALLGRPGMFLSPLSGTIEVHGGGEESYRFSVDARGDIGVVDLEGWYVPGDIPQYAASGVVAGMNLADVAVADLTLPRTALTLTIDLEGQGTTLETLDGVLELTVTGTAADNLPVDVTLRQLVARQGVLSVGTARVSVGENRLSASGTLGLTRPAPGTLEYALVVPDLNALTPVAAAVRGMAPRLNGSFRANGWVDGTLETPRIATSASGSALRYEDWRLGTITVNGEASRAADGWSGRGSVEAGGIELAGGESLETVRFEADAGPASIGLGLFIQRDPQANVAASGTVHLSGRQVRGADLQRLSFHLGEADWQLAAPTRLAWSDSAGLRVDSLLVRRTTGEPAWILAAGHLPPTGTADILLRGAGIDMANMRHALQPTPDVRGIFALDARIRGPVADPDMALRLRMHAPRFRGGEADTVTFVAQYRGGRAEVQAAAWAANRSVLDARASVPMSLSLESFDPSFEIGDADSLAARLVLDSLPVSLLTAVIPGLQGGQGIANGDIVVGGTTDQPELGGSMVVEDGAFDVDALGLRYTDVQARLGLDGDLIRIESLSARSEGVASLTGTIRLDELDRAEVYLTADLNNFVPIDREDFVSIHASGRAALSGRMPNPVLTGRLSLADGVITIPELGGEEPLEITDVEVGQVGTETVPTEVAEPGLASTIRIDAFEVSLGQGVWVEAEDEARIQIGGDLVLYRTGENLRVYGNLIAERGTYTLEIGPLTREFNVVSGQIQFFGTPDFNPSINIQAIYPIRTGAGDQRTEINVLVNLTGSLQSPEVELTSDTRPPIAETDLFSYLIFGRPSYALGGLRGDLAQDLLVQELAGNVILSPIEEALLGAGIFDYVRITGPPVEGGAAAAGQGELGTALESTFGSTTIEAGRELLDEWFITAECIIGGVFVEVSSPTQCGLGLDWQIDRQWSSSVAYEPIRRDPQLQRFNLGIGNQFQYQFSTELRRQWEYGGGLSGAPAPETPQAEMPGEMTAPPPDAEAGDETTESGEPKG